MNNQDKQREQIKKALMAIGAEEKDIDSIIQDIGNVILQKIITEYVSKLDEETQEKLKGLSEEEAKKYIEDNKETLPTPLGEEEIESIASDTWKDYFKTMTEKK